MPPHHLDGPARHRRTPRQSPTVRRAGLVGLSAAVVAGVATAGIMLSHPTSGARAHIAGDSAAVVDAGIADPTGGSRSKPATSTSAPAPTPKTGAAATKPTNRSRPKPVTSRSAPARTRSTTVKAAPKPPSEKLLDFDFQLQTTYYYCGPAATHMALSAHGANVGQDQLASQLGTTTNGTNSAQDTTRVLNSVLNTNVYRARFIPGQGATPAEMDQLQADVVHAISNGYGIVANIIGTATDTAGVQHDFSGGHFIAIVGYTDDGRTVKIADSSGMYGPGTYFMSTINAANWIATRGYSA
jgi:hypothetical protein